jgi:hypothetical protein
MVAGEHARPPAARRREGLRRSRRSHPGGQQPERCRIACPCRRTPARRRRQPRGELKDREPAPASPRSAMNRWRRTSGRTCWRSLVPGNRHHPLRTHPRGGKDTDEPHRAVADDHDGVALADCRLAMAACQPCSSRRRGQSSDGTIAGSGVSRL